MEKRDKADELINSLDSIEPLEDVPSDVSKRFNETLMRLSSEASFSKPKSRWFSNSNQFALAASFVLVFALGAVITLNSGGKSVDPLGALKPQPTNSSSNSDITEDQILYSGDLKSIPESSMELIKSANSLHDYVQIPMDFYKKLGVGSTWNSADKLESRTQQCLKLLELDDSINLIDTGLYEGKAISAFWAPVTRSSWNVYLVNDSCVAIDKKFVQG